ncbi:universal stress protein [Thiopseudomonas alkaliphila]|uniref:universal stress protein n=1 Tax=Thiopseudomonas alkaliphila TaxID=1697053 RepID=UPI0035712314
MRSVRSILVVLNPAYEEPPALIRAKHIAQVTQSDLYLLACDKDGTQHQSVQQLITKLRDEGFSVKGEASWHNSFHETVIQAQQAFNCGLVIKEHHAENLLKKVLLTPEDWKLLRFCPAPVLIVKTTHDWSNGNVLAAVDLGNTEPEHRELQNSIVSTGLELTQVTKGKLHLFTAHPSPMLSAADPTFQLRDTIENRYKGLCDSLVSLFDLDPALVSLKEGPADLLIPRTADEVGAVLTVMGTVARTGLSGALIGNTAEVVLDSIQTDVLVLKPQDRIEQLERDLKNKT